MNFHFIDYQQDGAVAVITLNRPEVLNSFHREMSHELRNALRTTAEDSSIRAILLTGRGRGFCAGQDLAAVLPRENEPDPDLGEIVADCYSPLISLLRTTEKPIICAVNGIAAGAGANLAYACDFVLAAASVSFVQSFCKIGLVPDSGGTFFLPRLVGLPRATAMAMLGEKITATRAAEIGLIYKVCPEETLLEEAGKLAHYLASQPTRGLGYIKRALNQSLSNDLETQLGVEAELQGAAGRTEDYKEGVRAFIEKRKAKFSGN